MPLREQLTAKVGRAFTKVANRLEGGCTVRLMRASGDYDEYDELLTLTDSVFFEEGDEPDTGVLSIGKNTDALAQALGNDTDEITATHLWVDNDFYTIRQGDTKPPKGARPMWRVFLEVADKPTRFTSMR